MDRVLSTHLFVQHRLTTVLLDRIWDASIPRVELFFARQHLDWRNKAQVNELGYWFRDAELKVHAIHAPMYSDDVWGRSGPDAVLSITERVKSKRLQVVDELKRSLEVAETVPFRYCVLHLGASGEEFDEFKVDAAFSALEELILFARQRGVEILLENTANGLSSAERLLTFLELTHLPLNICFDTGHAHMNEGVEAAFSLLRTRVRSVHVNDNDGKEDLHLFPPAPQGGVDWTVAMGLLRPLPLVLELRAVEAMEHPILEANAVFDRLEAL